VLNPIAKSKVGRPKKEKRMKSFLEKLADKHNKSKKKNESKKAWKQQHKSI